MTEIGDEALLAAWQAGDKAAGDVLVRRYFSLLFLREARGDARPEPIARVLAPADPGMNVEPDVDRRALEWLRGDGAPLSGFDRSARSAGTETENVRALRRHDALAGRGADSATWRKALTLLEEYAMRGSEEALRTAVIRGINALHRVSASGAITDQQMEPAAFRDPARASPRRARAVAARSARASVGSAPLT